MTADDPFELQRFVLAQERVIEAVTQELRDGRKRTHWMWFVFPQLKGLGRSPTAQLYGLASIEEALAYLEHPILGPRLEETTRIVLTHPDRTAHTIFGSPDGLKFHSSMTVFDAIDARGDRPFRSALRAFYDGQPDERTLELLDHA